MDCQVEGLGEVQVELEVQVSFQVEGFGKVREVELEIGLEVHLEVGSGVG